MPNYDEYSSLWEGNSPNATHAFRRLEAAGMAPDNSWLERLFGRKSDKITSKELPPMVPTDEGRFPPSPFGGASATPKPASKISSAAEIATRIGKMIATANEPPPVTPADFGLPPSEYRNPQDPLAASVNQYPAQEPPPPRIPVDMRTPPSSTSLSEFLGGLPADLGAAVSRLLSSGTSGVNREKPSVSMASGALGGGPFGALDKARRESPFGGFSPTQFPAYDRRSTLPAFSIPEMNPEWQALEHILGTGNRTRFAYARGGDVPGFMRGGYPELYNAPVRHFDSGGENYVSDHSNADGRADDVSARLSPKEYVIDAETMSMLGNGNPDHGAKKMDQFRANVRKHKGKALAEGKFSPNAKNPAEYLIGNPIGDGIRRRGKGK